VIGQGRRIFDNMMTPRRNDRDRWETKTMRPHAVMALTLGAILVLGAAARAELATPTLPASPPPPEYGLPITNEQAKEAASAAIAEAKKNSWRMAIAVVGPDGSLVYFEKLDGTQNASVLLAQAKARTSVLFRRPSKVFADQFAAGNTGFMSFPDEARPIASEGGIPIVVNGKLIGAIGASGGTGPQDGVAATAGANAVTTSK
jgi:glc operon protein GlcG